MPGLAHYGNRFSFSIAGCFATRLGCFANFLLSLAFMDSIPRFLEVVHIFRSPFSVPNYFKSSLGFNIHGRRDLRRDPRPPGE
jgi:hypothetical protein